MGVEYENEGWKCIYCLNLSPTVYEALTTETNSNFRWFCEECDELVMGTVSKNLIDDLGSQIACLTSKIENLLQLRGKTGRRPCV